MRNWKRLIYYLTINILVSVCATLGVLFTWDRLQSKTSGSGLPDAAQTTASPGTPGMKAESTVGPGTPAPTLQAGGTPAATAAAAPEATATMPSGSDVLTYEVRSGDTLGAIAVEFDVSVDAIIAANELTNPDRLEVGQVLVIPPVEGGEETATTAEEGQPAAEGTPTDARGTAGTPTQTAPSKPGTPAGTAQPLGEAGVVIDGVIGAGDIKVERIFMKRTGGGDLNLTGWQLVEDSGNVFTFPQFKLFQDGAVYVYTRAGQSTSVELYWGLADPVWKSGETVVLLDDTGKVRATYQVP
jgi:LysM repeat protein